jgi:hypothetical protein
MSMRLATEITHVHRLAAGVYNMVLGSMSINTHSTIRHCKSMLVTRPIIHILDTSTWVVLHTRLN